MYDIDTSREARGGGLVHSDEPRMAEIFCRNFENFDRKKSNYIDSIIFLFNTSEIL